MHKFDYSFLKNTNIPSKFITLALSIGELKIKHWIGKESILMHLMN